MDALLLLSKGCREGVLEIEIHVHTAEGGLGKMATTSRPFRLKTQACSCRETQPKLHLHICHRKSQILEVRRWQPEEPDRAPTPREHVLLDTGKPSLPLSLSRAAAERPPGGSAQVARTLVMIDILPPCSPANARGCAGVQIPSSTEQADRFKISYSRLNDQLQALLSLATRGIWSQLKGCCAPGRAQTKTEMADPSLTLGS